MNAEFWWVDIIKVLMWPVTIFIIIIVLRKAVIGAISRLRGLEAPTGWKLLFEVKKIGNRLNKLEELTVDIYNISGESQAVRDEIFTYIADILKKVSPQTALEMKTELNKYHMDGLEVSVNELKHMLHKLKYYKRSESEQKTFNNDISPEYIDAMYRFQKDMNMRDADGIIGPKTLKLLTSKVSVSR